MGGNIRRMNQQLGRLANAQAPLVPVRLVGENNYACGAKERAIVAATWARFAAVQRAAEQPSRSPVRIAGRLVHALARAEALSAGRRGATDSSGPESGRALQRSAPHPSRVYRERVFLWRPRAFRDATKRVLAACGQPCVLMHGGARPGRRSSGHDTRPVVGPSGACE